MSRIDFYLRAVAAGIWFLMSCVIGMAILPFRWRDPSMGAVFARILSFVGLRLLGLRMRIHDGERLSSAQPCVYVANHQTNLDIFTLGSIYPFQTVVIGKKELKWLPLFGLFFVGAGNIMIDRKNRTDSLAGLGVARDAVMSRRLSVWVFPEGTRNRGRHEMLPFKKGAFHLAIAAQVPIVPIVQQHLKTYFDYGARRLVHDRKIHVRVLEPVPTRGMSVEDLPRLMADVRSRMEQVLREPGMAPP